MDFLTVLTSLNKVSLVAFLVTLGFIIFQFFLFKGESKKSKEKKIAIPDFNEVSKTYMTLQTSIDTKPITSKTFNRTSFYPIIIGMILLILFGSIFLIGILNSKKSYVNTIDMLSPTPNPNLVASKGIRIYNEKWKEIPNNALVKLQSGEMIYIAIETINGSDIDSARIRVNKPTWNQEDITVKFDKQKNSFYREHIISTGSALLKIEAQLHSKTDGWMGN